MKHGLLIENYGPYTLGLIATLIWHTNNISLPAGEGILGSSMTVGAIFTGFLATAKAILMSLKSRVLSRIKDTGYIENLVSYLSQAIWLSFIFCCLSLLGYFFPKFPDWYGYVWIAIAVSMAFAFIRVTNIMLKILKKD
jgi:hypothetical protein